jgi:poly(A) polymerase
MEKIQEEEEMNVFHALQKAGSMVTAQQSRNTSIPKRFSLPMKEIWSLQPRFMHKTGGRPFKLLSHPRFRAAYDFLLLRAESGEVSKELAEWWTTFQFAEPHEQKKMTSGPGGARKKRRRPPRKRKPASRDVS